MQRIKMFEDKEEASNQQNLQKLLSDKIGPASGIKQVDSIIKAIKERNGRVMEVIKKMDFLELGLPTFELID